jgi:hypothetical protein
MDTVSVGLLDSSSHVMQSDECCLVIMGMPKFLYDVEGLNAERWGIPPPPLKSFPAHVPSKRSYLLENEVGGGGSYKLHQNI